MNKEKLIQNLIDQKYLRTPAVIKAFKKVDRKDFVLAEHRDEAYLDEALPIGWGQTISQPLTVAFMLEWLQPQKGDKILDIGSGSGWKAVLLACLVGEKGKVVSIEIIPELHHWAKANAAKYPKLSERIKFVLGDGSKGFPSEAPYDKIIAGAAGRQIPGAWKKQLKKGGRIVAPVGQEMLVVDKRGAGRFTVKSYPGFYFVPLVEK